MRTVNHRKSKSDCWKPIDQTAFPLPKRLIFWGGTGQAKAMRPVVEYYGSRVVAVVDRTCGLTPPFEDVPLVHESEFDGWLASALRAGLGFCLTIGNPHGRVRLALHRKLIALGLAPATVIHPTAWIAPNASIGAGAQIQAQAVVEAEVQLGRQCIVNTRAGVDHECHLADGVEIAPGATLCGLVRAGVNAWVGAGATVLPRISIGSDAVVGAGAVVIRDVAAGITVAGVPAKQMAKKRT